MNKKLLRALSLMFIMITMSVLVALSIRSTKTKSNSVSLTQIVPTLVDIDNQSIDQAVQNRGTVLVFFNSTCDHCHFQAQEIYQRISLFKDKAIIFFSFEPMNEIRMFADSSKLHGTDQVFFAHMDIEKAETFFESLAIPSLFIYGTDGMLKTEIKGEAKAQAIVKHLN